MNSPKGFGSMASPPLQSSPFSIQIRTFSVMTSCVVLSIVTAAVTFVLIDGFDLTTVNATSLSDDGKSDLLDKYNSYSAAVASIASMPLIFFASKLLPLFFLCFWTNAVLASDKSFSAMWIPMAVSFAVTWVIGQGMNAVNVQFSSPTYNYVIVSSDLADTSANESYSSVATSIANSSHVAGIPSTDTILRNAIRSLSKNSSTTCSGYSGTTAEASIRYDFRLNSWLEDMLPESIASDESFSFSMSEDFSSRTVDASTFPGGDLNKTAELFSYGFWALWRQFGEGWSGTDMIYTSAVVDTFEHVNSAAGAELLGNIQTFIANLTSQLEENLEDNLEGEGIMYNVSTPDITIEFANFQLSPQIKFEAVTFDLPIKDAILKDYLDQSNDTDFYWTAESVYDCSDYACVFENPVPDGLYRDQVRLLPFCTTGVNSTQVDLSGFGENCEYQSSSVLLFSLGRHISADEVKFSNSTIMRSYPILKVKNPRKIYHVTVGRLSWETVDLAEHYGAECASGTNCDGLYFPLSNGEQHVVVGESQVPTPNTPLAMGLYDGWDVLAMANTQTAASTQGDIIYPPNYRFSADSDEWTTALGNYCGRQWIPFVDNILQKHMYSKDSVQPAYTAGLFWLFQNAALRDIQASSTTASGSGIRLAFDGNVEWISSHVSIPLTSAIVSFVGIAIVLVLGIFVTYWGTTDRPQKALAENLTANSVATMIVGTAQYPPYMVRKQVIPNNGAAPFAADEFEIEEMALRHKTDPAHSTTFQRPGASLLNTTP